MTTKVFMVSRTPYPIRFSEDVGKKFDRLLEDKTSIVQGLSVNKAMNALVERYWEVHRACDLLERTMTLEQLKALRHELSVILGPRVE